MEVAMSKAGKREAVEGRLLFEREDLEVSVESILKGDAHAPDALAQLFVMLKLAIDGGLEGINQASEALLTGIEVAYLHSRTHDAATKLYFLSRQGELKFPDEPLELINAAIGRSTAKKHLR